MNNSFVNWVTLQIPASRADEVKALKLELEKSEITERFNIKSISTYSLNYGMRIQHLNDNKARRVRCRDVDEKRDFLLTDIVKSDNLLLGEKFGTNDLSVIVTAKFLNDFGYDSYFCYMLPFTVL